MSWYSADYARRCAVLIDNVGGSVGSVDATFTPEVTHPLWSVARSDGADFRLTAADGVSLLTFDTSGLDVAAKAGTFEIDGFSAPAARLCVAWLYFGNPDETSNGRTTFAPSAAKSAYTSAARAGEVIAAAVERPGALRPRNVVSKNTAEKRYVWFDFGPRLLRRVDPYEGRELYEEVSYITITASADGASYALFVEADTRLVGQASVGVRLTDGVDGTDYVLRCEVTTTLGNKLLSSVLVRVRDTDDG